MRLTDDEKRAIAETMDDDLEAGEQWIWHGLVAGEPWEYLALARAALDQAGFPAEGQQALNELIRQHLLGDWT